jgi:hypothetical protein
MSDQDNDAAGTINVWLCPTCQTLTLLDEALADRCCREPRWPDCPLPALIAAFARQGPDRLS